MDLLSALRDGLAAPRKNAANVTPVYIDVAKELTAWIGLTDHCRFHIASALGLPAEDGVFDGAFTFHVAMNIEDRPAIYREAHRILKTGGFLCLFDVMKGPADSMRYSVPQAWAEEASTGFLLSRDETKSLLSVAGFKVAKEENLRDFTIEFFRDGMLSQKRWLQKVPCPVACTSDRHQRPGKVSKLCRCVGRPPDRTGHHGRCERLGTIQAPSRSRSRGDEFLEHGFCQLCRGCRRGGSGLC